MAHIRRNEGRMLQGATPPGTARGFGGPPGPSTFDVAITSTPSTLPPVLSLRFLSSLPLPPPLAQKDNLRRSLEYNVYSARQLAGTSARFHVQLGII